MVLCTTLLSNQKNYLSILPGNVIYLQDISEDLSHCCLDTFSLELMSRVDVCWSMELFTCFSLGFCLNVSLWHTHREPSLLSEMAWCVYICRASVCFPMNCFHTSSFCARWRWWRFPHLSVTQLLTLEYFFWWKEKLHLTLDYIHSFHRIKQ